MICSSNLVSFGKVIRIAYIRLSLYYNRSSLAIDFCETPPKGYNPLMPHVDRHAPGSFNWLELATTNQAAAKQFYSALLGWQAQDVPMGPNGAYTIFLLDGRPAAACFTIGANEQQVPPYWGLYIATEDVDQTAARATELGATLIHAAMDVSTFGRMAVIKDPTGAIFSVWQAKTHPGIGITGENGTLCWADLNTPDRERAKTFYEQLFVWELEPGKDKSVDDYLHIVNAGQMIGGIPTSSQQTPGAPPHWLVYFQIADCDASTAKAQELGARVYMPPTSINENLRLSVLADPQGAVFALFAAQA